MTCILPHITALFAACDLVICLLHICLLPSCSVPENELFYFNSHLTTAVYSRVCYTGKTVCMFMCGKSFDTRVL